MNRKSKTRASLTHLSVLTNSIMAPALRHRGGVLAQLIQLWPEIAGDMADWSRPDDLRFAPGRKEGGTLKLSIATARGPEAQSRQAEIVKKCNAALGFGAIERITLHQSYQLSGKQAGGQDRPEKNPGTDIARLHQLEAATRTIRSPELRAALIRLGRTIGEQE